MKLETDAHTYDSEAIPIHYIDKGKVRFMYKGRHYTLFKPQLGGSFYIKIQKQGYRKTTSLHTDDPDRAVAMALGVIDYMLTGVDPEALKEPSHASADLVTRSYRILALRHGLKERTIEGNISALKKIIGRRKSLKNFPMSRLTGKLVREFIDFELDLIAGQGEDARQGKLRSIQSVLKQAKSIFKKSFHSRYEDAGIYLGNIEGFLLEQAETPASVDKEPLEDEVVEVLDAKVEKLSEVRPDFHAAYMLAKSTLRRGEIQRAKWDWVQMKKGQPHIVMSADQKGKKPTAIPLDPKIYSALQRWYKLTEDKEYILPEDGWTGERCGYFMKELDKWLRNEGGLKTDHTFHELRAHTLHTIREKYGLEVAATVGRHSEAGITAKHYTGKKQIPANFSFQ
jgi:integrase